MRQDCEHTWHRLRGGRIDRGNLSLGEVTFDCPTVRAFRHFELDGILGRAGYLESSIDSIPRGPHYCRTHSGQILSAAAVWSARTMLRFANSILKALCL